MNQRTISHTWLKVSLMLLCLLMLTTASAESTVTYGPRTYEPGMRLIATPRNTSAKDSVTAITAAYFTCDHNMLTVGEEVTWTLTLEGQSADAYTYDYWLWHQELTDTSNMYYSSNYLLDVTDPFFTAVADVPGRYFLSVTVKDQYGGQLEVQSAIYIAEKTMTLSQKVAEIVALCKGSGCTSDYDIARFMHDYLINNACYDETYTYYFPEGVLLYGTGVCQSYALAYQILMEEMGIDCLYVTGVAGGVDHAWNMVDIDGQWYQVDCTWDDPIMLDESGNVVPGGERHDYFCISDEKLAVDHTWDRGLFPECTEDYKAAPPSEAVYPESAHPYPEDCDITWSYTHPQDAYALKITFSEATELEEGYDFLLLTSKDGIEQQFTGTELQGKTVYVVGNSFTLRLTSDWKDSFYGFAITAIEAMTLEDAMPQYTIDAGGMITSYSSLVSEIVVPEEIDGVAVTAIGSAVFRENAYLTSIVLPEGVTTIGNSAFADCINLKTIDIPDSVTDIGAYTFENCSSLTSVNIPGGVTCIRDSAFRNCSSLTSISIPDGVTSIDEWAFSDCSNLISISVPNSVTSIGRSAFDDCSSLTSFVIPDGVTSLENQLFAGCSSLTSVRIPDSVTSFDYNVFRNCSSLTSINIPDGVTSLGSGVFNGCSSLTSIDIPAGVTEIGSHAFCGCSELTSVVIPDGVTEIGSLMFEECRKLTSIVIPEGVTKIGDSAFRSCWSLSKVEIPDTVTEIGYWAFMDCSNLYGMVIPESVTSIGEDAFNRSGFVYVYKDSYAHTWCEENGHPYRSVSIMDYAYTITDGEVTVTGYAGKDTEIEVPSKIEGYPVVALGDSAFSGNENLVSVSIPGSIAKLPRYTFSDCSSLAQVTLGEGMVCIGEYAFDGCVNLKEIQLPESLETIETGAFFETGLTTLTLPKNVSNIPCGWFGYFWNDRLTAFYVDENNATYKSVDGVLYDREGTLISCPPAWAGHLKIAEGTTWLGAFSFSGCSKITEITIPEGVQGGGEGTLGSLSSIKTLTLPASYMQKSALYSVGHFVSGCLALEEIRVAAGNKVLYAEDGVLFMRVNNGHTVLMGYPPAKSATTYVVPEGVSSIDMGAFYNAANLKNVTISGTVEDIQYHAFAGCSGLEQVTMHDGVKTLGSDIFSECNNLTVITLPGSITYIDPNALMDIPNLTAIYCDHDTYAEQWANENGYGALVRNGNEIQAGVWKASKIDDSHCCIISYLDTGTKNVIVPDKIDGYVVTEIGGSVFKAHQEIESISIPDTVTKIGIGAFAYCQNMRSIRLPKGLKEISDEMFMWCGMLKDITIPYGVTRIGEYAFQLAINSDLASIDIPSTVIEIGSAAFNNTNLVKMNLPSSVQVIGDDAFSECANLKEIYIPDSVTSIGSSALSYNSDELVMYCNSTSYAAQWAIDNNFEQVVYLDDLWNAAVYTWANDNSTVTAIRTHKTDSSLDVTETVQVMYAVSVSPTETTKGETLFRAMFESALFTVQEKILQDIPALSDMLTVYLPTSLTTIEAEAFAGLPIQAVIVPEGCTSIGARAFADCAEFLYVYIPASTVIADDAFDGCSSVHIDIAR